jgi:hypothetical protein
LEMYREGRTKLSASLFVCDACKMARIEALRKIAAGAMPWDLLSLPGRSI